MKLQIFLRYIRRISLRMCWSSVKRSFFIYFSLLFFYFYFFNSFRFSFKSSEGQISDSISLGADTQIQKIAMRHASPISWTHLPDFCICVCACVWFFVRIFLFQLQKKFFHISLTGVHNTLQTHIVCTNLPFTNVGQFLLLLSKHKLHFCFFYVVLYEI